jgi:TPR repeat protein
MKRIKKNCPVAMCHMGKKRYHQGDYDKAFAYFTTAAELGDAGAHYNLSCLYRDSEGVEKDMKKQVYHLEEAAIGGHPSARYNLGIEEENNGRYERAVKHWIIGSNLGHDQSLKGLKDLYAEGYVSKEEYANALRAYQASVDATKSEEREKAEEGETRWY